MANCVQSLVDLLQTPFDLHIYDDDSTDQDQLNLLASYQSRHRVYVNKNRSSNEKVKGLHGNMNLAVSHIVDGYDYGLMLQDDTQMVRPFTKEDMGDIKEALCIDNVFAVTSFFYKKNHPKDYKGSLDYVERARCYVPKNGSQGYLTGVADMGFFSGKKLRDTNWKFEANEGAHIEKGRQQGLVRAATLNPFFSFLPWPTTSRGSWTSLRHILTRILDKYYHTGFYPLAYMSESQLTKLGERDLFDFPFAEDYLHPRGGVKLHTPWNFYDSFYPFKKKIKKLLNR